MRQCFILMLLLTGSAVFGQNDKPFTPNELKKQLVSFGSGYKAPVTLRLPFSGVDVLDARFDTCKIGFTRNRRSQNKTKGFYKTRFEFKRLVIKSGLQDALANFYNRSYNNNFTQDSNRLLIVVKKFWADPFPNLLKVREQKVEESRESTFNLHLQFEFLLQREGLYMPIKRIDTIFQVNPVEADGDLIEFSKDGMSIYEYVIVKTFESIDYTFYSEKFGQSKNKKSLSDIIAFNNKRFNQPILRDSILMKGVYMSFSEFRNNKPSVLLYKTVIDKKLGKSLWYNTDKDSTMIFNAFGYCDGEKIYCGDFRYPITRMGQTFDFFINRTDHYKVTLPTAMLPTDLPIGLAGDKEIFLEPFQIDMESGRVY